ncbi:TonB-dependent receptor domain-containing protein [Chitinophaga sp. GCM10012297]|uniref:TonB-dependent receptor n=1 Tax=Chitinophaga chungangae TaxID=2821488 RepID=A0ABS3YFR2_9BACT|nr:TonB-dependent receptor [Chitinophaga chungangae]MBO9153522.1 TonB-dependent receptor [Chitinophaga chungangae]
MKLRILCIIILLACTMAPARSRAQDMARHITLPATDLKGKELIALIEQTGSVQFTYGKEVSGRLERPLRFRHAQPTVKEALGMLQSTLGITHSVDGAGAIILKSAPADTPAQPADGRVSGKVIDESNGDPLPFVTVRIGNKGTTTKADGSFVIILPPGEYVAEVSSIGYVTKRITEIVLKNGQTFELNVTLKRQKSTLSGIVVTSSASRESVASLYARQKNEAGISNGISREQIAALPDKHIGETLKRISGVSTNDNRRVVIRGIAERYNIAMMDGAILPSTDVQVRDFEFDIIPNNLIDNVIVSKTATPDMSFGFGGGLVQVNTFAIPHQNFTIIGIGGKYVSGVTGKSFLGYGRGKYDYLGFDDGSRDHFPDNLLLFDGRNYNPTNPNAQPEPGKPRITPEQIAEQNKRIGGLERLGTRTYKAAPGQNYQVSLGRSYNVKNSRIGFVGSITYRNEQSIDDIEHFERGNWEKLNNRYYDAVTGEEMDPTFANQYNFNTTWGALLNAGWSAERHKITVRNFYSRVFNNQFNRMVGWGNEIGYQGMPAIREYDRPKFIDMLQNRLNGDHTFGRFRFEWNVARNKLSNLEQDAVEAWLAPVVTLNDTGYNVIPHGVTNPGTGPFNRAQYLYEETNRSAEGALSYSARLFGQKQLAKAGYQFMDRHGYYDWTILPIGTASPGNSVFPFTPVQGWNPYLEFKDPMSDLLYYPAAFSANGYEGKNTNQAYYAMLDNRFTKWLRLVWGIRAEYYKYERMRNSANDRQIDALIREGERIRYVDPETGKIVSAFADPVSEEKTWRYLPSASLTVTPLQDFNIRAAYAQSVVRPSLIENSRMIRFDPALGAYRMNEGVLSTTIDHYDLRLEWYPQPGEVISFGWFYKYFDRPAEIYRDQPDATARIYVRTSNSEWAKVQGWEFDLRKSFGFLNPHWKFLQNLYLSGNLTLQNSTVQAAQFGGQTMSTDKYGFEYRYRTKKQLKEKRPLYGQVPVLYNIALQYAGKRLGANIAFNHMGYKTFTTGMSPNIVEFERPRNQLDAQLSYAFLKSRKLMARLNMSNLTNSAYRYYINSDDTYQVRDKYRNMPISAIPETEWDAIYEWKFGFSRKYEEGYLELSQDGKTKRRIGDQDTFIRKVGSSFSLSAAYTF